VVEIISIHFSAFSRLVNNRALLSERMKRVRGIVEESEGVVEEGEGVVSEMKRPTGIRLKSLVMIKW
jgi:hypothetical protein